MYSKKQITSVIADLGRKLGRAPSLLVFLARSGISRRSVQRFFPKWNDAVTAARLLPYTVNVKVEDRALLEDWGKAVRKNRGVPARFTYMRGGKYNPSTMERRFGSWTALPEAFCKFAIGKREWTDVLTFLAAQAPKKETHDRRKTPGPQFYRAKHHTRR